jgi:gliding motility-associated-like protein
MKSILFLVLIYCHTLIVSAQNITVDDTKNAAEIVKILTNSSPCVFISEEKTKGNTDIPIMNSYGSFSKNGSNFPFETGIILSSWSSIYSKGPFIREPPNTTKSGSSNWGGDTDLENALRKGNTFNATVLEFDFTPQTNYISFNYIFASNEYQDDFPCGYSDGFAFLIRENALGANYQNLAVLPDGTPVSSKTVHPAFNFNATKCDAINETYFGQLNNSPTNTSPINYSGQTKVLTAQSKVTAGTSYHMKLVIADQNGNLYDSAVFLEAGSFSSKIDLGQDRLIAKNNPICFGETVTLSTNLPGSHQWTKTDSSGTKIQLETSSSLVIQDAGIYNVEATVSSCTVTGKIKIEYAPELILEDVSLTRCDNNENGTAIFDLTKAENAIKKGDSSLTTVTYYKTQTGTVLTDLITNPTTFTKTNSADQLVYAKVMSKTYGCTKTAKITLQTVTTELSTFISTASPIVNNFSGNQNSIQLITPSTGGPYAFSLDGTNYQYSPLFTNIVAGNYLAYVQDSETCKYLTYPIIILDYPRYFTPNNDGYNDTWNIKNLDLLPAYTITIYDRYGKLLKKLNSSDRDWNGSFNGSELPSDDYWFSLSFENGKNIKGHFSLKR